MKKTIPCALTLALLTFGSLLGATGCGPTAPPPTAQDIRVLRHQLDRILVLDQTYRQRVFPTINRYGLRSPELAALQQAMHRNDSLNARQVEAMLDRFGWLGPAEVGPAGNRCLFLVIQHADHATQEKALPLLRRAVTEGKALRSHLALLEDRLAVRRGQPQPYGSQTYLDPSTGRSFFCPIADAPNVNRRRKSMGLGPLEAYAQEHGIEHRAPAPLDSAH